MSEMVLVARSCHSRTQGGRFHTDPDCAHAARGEMRERSRSYASDEMGLTECRECSGEVNKSHPGTHLASNVDELDIPPLDGGAHE